MCSIRKLGQMPRLYLRPWPCRDWEKGSGCTLKRTTISRSDDNSFAKYLHKTTYGGVTLNILLKKLKQNDHFFKYSKCVLGKHLLTYALGGELLYIMLLSCLKALTPIYFPPQFDSSWPKNSFLREPYQDTLNKCCIW